MKRESDRYYTAMELLKQYRQADEEQAAFMQSALEIMRNHHKHGEMYYWILYYSFLQESLYKISSRLGGSLGAYITDGLS